MMEQFVARYAQLRREFEDRTPEQNAMIRSQTAEWLEKTAARYWEYQILTAYFRMTDQAAGAKDTEDHNYNRGRRDQAQADALLADKIVKLLSDNPNRGTPTT